MLDPIAEVPCQLDRVDISPSDHSAGSKESTQWPAMCDIRLCIKTVLVYTFSAAKKIAALRRH